MANGYFRQRGKQKLWSFTVDIGKDSDGVRKQQSGSGFKTKKEAQLAASEILKEVNDGTYVKEKDTLFKDYAADWHKVYEDSVKPGTAGIRQWEMNCLNEYFKFTKIKDITKKKYQGVLSELRKKGYADNTIAGIHSTARMIFREAKEDKVIKIDPTEKAKRNRTRKTVEQIEQTTEIPKYLEKEELAHFLTVAKADFPDDIYLRFLLLAYSGIRAGELCVLKWSDINYSECTVSITKTYYNPSGNVKKYQLEPPKTDSSIRIIELDETIMSEFKRYQEAQNSLKSRIGNVYHDKEFIFINMKRNPGYPTSVHHVEYYMRRILKLAKLNESLTPHSLRHTHTSLLAEAGVGLEEIMERLGHYDDDTTRKIYLHVTKSMKKEAAKKFSNLMNSLLKTESEQNVSK